MIQKNFKIPSTAKSIVENDILYITGVANTGLEDLVGDVVTREALQQIRDQISTHNLHLDHDKEISGVLGPLVEGWLEADGLHFKARILEEKRDFIESYLRQGVNLGASISGLCEYNEGSTTDIAQWQLTEISLTPVPCDQGTMATVEIAKSFRDAVQAVQEIKNKEEGDNMAEQNEEITIEKIEEMINTAFNEKQEDLVESVRSELKAEYEATLNELKERIETLESQGVTSDEEGDDGDSNGQEGEGTEGEGNGNTASSGEGKSSDEDEDGDEDEDPKDDDKKNLESLIEKAVQKSISDIFNPKSAPSFQYDKKVEDGDSSKGYTPKELAQLLTQ